MAKIRGGVDPGKKGFIVYHKINKKGVIKETVYLPIPLISGDYDNIALTKIFEDICGQSFDIHFVLENVSPDPSWGTKGNFSMGGCIQMFKQLFACTRIPYTPVHPKTWQKEMHEGVKPIFKPLSAAEKRLGRKNGSKDVKGMSETAAKRLHPDVDFRKSARCKNIDDNKVDATLIADYCKRSF